MAVEFICDGCGKRALAVMTWRDVFCPRDWYVRSPGDPSAGEAVQLHACSRECLDRIDDERRERVAVLPL